MGMSTHVVGYGPPDERWRQMKAIWDGCKAARIPVPDEVEKFFGYSPPDDKGVEITIQATAWSDGDREGYEIEVAKIPPQCSVIRFYNSW
jgi:phage terminase large subunit GpA-like protein